MRKTKAARSINHVRQIVTAYDAAHELVKAVISLPHYDFDRDKLVEAAQDIRQKLEDKVS